MIRPSNQRMILRPYSLLSESNLTLLVVFQNSKPAFSQRFAEKSKKTDHQIWKNYKTMQILEETFKLLEAIT